MNPGLQQFISVALPIMVTLIATIWIASWSQNKRFDDWTKRFEELRADMNRRFSDMTIESNARFDDLRSDMNHRFGELKSDMNRRFDEVNARLGRIETKLDNHEERLVRPEERTSPNEPRPYAGDYVVALPSRA